MTIFQLLITSSGLIVVAVGLIDVFLSVLHYGGSGIITPRLYRGLWFTARNLASVAPRRARRTILSLAGPLMVAATVGVWVVLELLGFALLYLPALQRGQIAVDPAMDVGFWQALYLSGASISTVGFGDVTATTAPYQVATIAESLIGFALLTLSISYILNIYGMLRDKGVFAILLHTESGEGEEVVQRHLRGGSLDQFAGAISWIHEHFAHQYEGMRRYPPLYYFWSHEDERSLPNLVRKIGRIAAAARCALPTRHPMTIQPALLNLIEDYRTIVIRMSDDLDLEMPDDKAPASLDVFRAALTRNGVPNDESVERFLALERRAIEATGADPGDTGERYKRYGEWFHLTALADGFYAAAARDLGYDDG